MIRSLSVKGFKTLKDVNIELSKINLLLGNSESGRTNTIEAMKLFSDLCTETSLTKAFEKLARGYPIEAFTNLGSGDDVHGQNMARRMSFEANLELEEREYIYKLTIEIKPDSGRLYVTEERLTELSKGIKVEIIKSVEDNIFIKGKGKGGIAHKIPLKENYTVISDSRLDGIAHPSIAQLRNAVSRWGIYRINPHIIREMESPISDTDDIGMFGEKLIPFIHRLKIENNSLFKVLNNMVKIIVPSIKEIKTEVNKSTGTVDIYFNNEDSEFSIRVISDDTIYCLALCALLVNGLNENLLAIDDIEKMIDYRQWILAARLLTSSLKKNNKQLILTSQVPEFYRLMIVNAEQHGTSISIHEINRDKGVSVFKPLSPNMILNREYMLNYRISKI